MKAHFFDLESIISSDSKVWIVDRKSPKFPVMRISQSEFNLIKSGIYKSQGNQIKFAGKEYWIPEEMMGSLKIKCKNLKSDVSNLAFSMREYMDSDLIDSSEYEIGYDILRHLKNSQDDVYFICSENTKENYEKIISKIESKLEELGISVKKYYFISETFYERDNDEISHRKIRLLLQHLVGRKTDGDKFVDEEITSYDEVYFYDEDDRSISFAQKSNNLLSMILGNTEESLSKSIKSEIKSKKPLLKSVLVSPNKANRMTFKEIPIEYHNLIKTFEAFSWKRI
jgi:hypothetical protein